MPDSGEYRKIPDRSDPTKWLRKNVGGHPVVMGLQGCNLLSQLQLNATLPRRSEEPGDADGGIRTEFLRKTTKFWILPSNILKVKKRVLDQFGEFRFDGKKSKSVAESGSIVNSAYFDDDQFDVYTKRLGRDDQSHLYRYRWYTNKPAVSGFMEQKIRKPGWRGESSVKQRFSLPPELLQEFIEFGPRGIHEIKNKKLAREMYDDTCGWPGDIKPVLRTTYRRTCYQDYEGAAVRVSLDEEMVLTCLRNMSYEEALDPQCRVNDSSQMTFPIGILEVKQCFKTHAEMQQLTLPDWVVFMQEQNLIIQVAKFSKYLTGVAAIHMNVLGKIPCWFKATKELLDMDIANESRRLLGYGDCTEVGKLPMPNHYDDIVFPCRKDIKFVLTNERTWLKWTRMVTLGLLAAFCLEPWPALVMAVLTLVLNFRVYNVFVERYAMIKAKDRSNPAWADEETGLLFVMFIFIPAFVWFICMILDVNVLDRFDDHDDEGGGIGGISD